MMKRMIKLVAMLIVALCFTMPADTHAAYGKTKVLKLTSYMSTYEYMMLDTLDMTTVGESYEVILDDVQKAQAAALGLPLTDEQITGSDEEGFWSIYAVSSKKIKKLTKKLFGKAVSAKKLPKESDDNRGFIYAYRDKNGDPMIYCWEGETELDFETIEKTVKKSKPGYTMIKDVYFGYWGLNDHETANYRITCKVEKNAASSIGYVITGMTIERIAE